MSQTQLESLTAFFQQNVPPRAMQSFDSVLDEMKFIPAAKDYGLGQYRQAVIRYDAVISWQRFSVPPVSAAVAYVAAGCVAG
ncbi:FIG00641266: hypothetical protein [Citrobacter freundii]|uniref:Uncharacterized protein n=1 Tax=Citrobacter freundii TaxID=546 RepID=A0A7G2IV18_CITFR|nr:FIG00641266: hypothetical protein [Citrobacter freundii]